MNMNQLRRVVSLGQTLAASVQGDKVVFSGGNKGEHSIWLDVSSDARIQAHFEGYVESNGYRLRPAVGDHVSFNSKSANGYRHCRVTKVGPKRAEVEFTYPHSRGGPRVAHRSVPLSELVFH